MREDWKYYFETLHEGLGTTYERFVLHGYFNRIQDQYGVKTVLEAPVFGMTGISGINSVWWAVHTGSCDAGRSQQGAVGGS